MTAAVISVCVLALAVACVYHASAAEQQKIRAENILDELSETRKDLEVAEGAIKLDRFIIQSLAFEREQLKDYIEFQRLQILSLSKTGLFKDHDGKFRKREAS